jgi:hypothetical protein
MMARAMPLRRRRPLVAPRPLPGLAALALVALVAVGCGARTDDPLASHTPSPVAPSATPTPHEAPELETRLPKSIHGTMLAARSYTGATFLRSGTDQNQTALRAMLSRLGRSVDDLTLALAEDPNGSVPFVEGIFRVAGTPSDALEQAWVESQQAATQNRLVQGTVTIAGQRVDKITDAVAGGTTYIVARGDSLVLIVAPDPALTEEAVSKIP